MLIVIGIVSVLINPRINGNVIGINEDITYVNLIGIVVFLVGVLIALTEGTLQRRVSVYDKYKGKGDHKEEEAYSMTDPERYFGDHGFVSLDEFRRAFAKLRGDSELLELVRQEYGPELMKSAKSRSEEAEIAKSFLKVMYDNVQMEEREREYLDEHDKEEINNAFKGGWKNAPDSHQSRILKRYNLGYEHNGKHGRIYLLENPKLHIQTSVTPSDGNAGKNIARDLIAFIQILKSR